MDLYRRNLHWNTKNKSIATSGTSSDKDTTCQSQHTSANRSRTSNITTVEMGSSSSSSRTGSSESVTLVKCSSPNQSDRRRRSFRLKKGGLWGMAITAVVVLVVVLDLGARGGVEGAALKRRARSDSADEKLNVWERPCGDGKYHEKADTKNHIKKKKNNVKDVFLQTAQMLSTMSHMETEPHWIDGNWDHTLPDDFKFPDISHFTFRKAHNALQEYMAIFQMFTAGESERRQELRESFKKMQKDTRTLLCLVESVINGTHAVGRQQQQQLKQARGFSEGAETAAAAAAGRKRDHRPYKYYTKHVMDRKLKKFKDALTDKNVMTMAKSVFAKYKRFVDVLNHRAEMRAAKLKKNVNGGGPVAAGGGGRNKVNPKKRKNENQVAVDDDSVPKAVNEVVEVTKKPLNINNNKNNNIKVNKSKQARKGNKSKNGGGGAGGRVGGKGKQRNERRGGNRKRVGAAAVVNRRQGEE